MVCILKMFLSCNPNFSLSSSVIETRKNNCGISMSVLIVSKKLIMYHKQFYGLDDKAWSRSHVMKSPFKEPVVWNFDVFFEYTWKKTVGWMMYLSVIWGSMRIMRHHCNYWQPSLFLRLLLKDKLFVTNLPRFVTPQTHIFREIL